MLQLSRSRRLWLLLLGGTSGVMLLVLLPPFLPAEVGALIRQAFAPVCHQLPDRSPHIGGTPIAICDRCSGVYAGVVLGVAGVGGGREVWRRLGASGRYLLIGALVPLGIDWIGPVLGLWSSGPASRALTGFLFGAIAASYVTDRLLRKEARADSSGGPGQS